MNGVGSNQAIESERLETTETMVQTFVFPASYAQQRLWLSDQLEPGTHLHQFEAVHLEVAAQVGPHAICVTADVTKRAKGELGAPLGEGHGLRLGRDPGRARRHEPSV